MRERNPESLKTSSVSPDRRPATIGLGALLALLLVFSVVVALVGFSVRDDIRRQLLDVDSHVLSRLVQNQVERAEQELGLIQGLETLDEIEIWSALLETATLKGVFAAQYYDVEGALRQSSSGSLIRNALDEETRIALAEGQSHTYFRSQVWLSDLVEVGFEGDRTVDVLDIYLPLTDGRGAQDIGTARFLMDGSSLAREFRLLDERLARQALAAIGIGGVAMSLLFWLAWKRLGQSNARVLRQAERLKRVNGELAALARASAVGSVTAHLIHGLKNPLAGLRQVVSAQQSGSIPVDEEDWKGASEAADRMQRLVEEVIGVLQDSSSGLSYEMDSSEALGRLRQRYEEDARRRGIEFTVKAEERVALEGSVLNIVSLIAGNLIENAFESTPPGGNVELLFASDSAGEECTIRVEDSGDGVPSELRDRLFTPMGSSKSGGAGIGLTISSQLARHLGGELRYCDEVGKGAVFELRFPVSRDSSAF